MDTSHDVHAWRQTYVHAQPWQSDDMPQVTVQSCGMSHARTWEESSELVVHTTYTTPNVGGSAFFTRDTVSRDLGSVRSPSLCILAGPPRFFQIVRRVFTHYTCLSLCVLNTLTLAARYKCEYVIFTLTRK